MHPTLSGLASLKPKNQENVQVSSSRPPEIEVDDCDHSSSASSNGDFVLHEAVIPLVNRKSTPPEIRYVTLLPALTHTYASSTKRNLCLHESSFLSNARISL